MRIGIIGCAGRMGRTLLREALATEGAELIGGVEPKGHAAVGDDLGILAGQEPIRIAVGSDLPALLEHADAVIEFSTPEATLANAALAAAAGCAHVVGTTGLSASDATRLREIAGQIPIVWAPNMSQGVNLLLGLVEQVARALDPGFDIEIVEMHHRHKVDAPSGTALALGLAAARGRGQPLDELAVRGRDGITGARKAGAIGFASLRGGDVVGDHSVIVAGEGERLVLSHIATDRRIYARGALRAALWTSGRGPGLYGMADVLGLGPETGGRT
jgi:4-hydroxy-tetrahydrodipicolinate reductase